MDAVCISACANCFDQQRAQAEPNGHVSEQAVARGREANNQRTKADSGQKHQLAEAQEEPNEAQRGEPQQNDERSEEAGQEETIRRITRASEATTYPVVLCVTIEKNRNSSQALTNWQLFATPRRQ
jgi:hypothetical protein